jgi:hypothetical protein
MLCWREQETNKVLKMTRRKRAKMFSYGVPWLHVNAHILCAQCAVLAFCKVPADQQRRIFSVQPDMQEAIVFLVFFFWS